MMLLLMLVMMLVMMLVVVMVRGWSRKILSLSLIGTAAHKHHRPIVVFLFHQGRVLEALQHGSLALDASVRDVADLITVEYLPLLAIVLTVERRNVSAVDKVHERVAAITAILEVNGQIKEVHLVRSVAGLGKFSQEHLLGVLVGNVAHHERGPSVLSALNCVDIKQQLRWIIISVWSPMLPRRRAGTQRCSMSIRMRMRIHPTRD
mmetsp:Transcript_22409/g.53106  ORF Transcript_22409/g.53106 Transcript_22409/m.53106 type:complete len:206 (-) Transcript_22409:2764-3381(-)